jgi:uncharacterized protein (TIGR02147 family)
MNQWLNLTSNLLKLGDMDLFDFDDYKQYVLARLENSPKRGHGQFRVMAEHLRVSSVYISQVFRRDKHLSPEQAYALCELFAFTGLEREYFFTLVQVGRAGSVDLQNYLRQNLQAIRVRAQNLKTRIAQQKELSDQAQAIFYSNWIYSAVRLLSAIDQPQPVESIAARFRLPANSVNRAIDFLVNEGLCVLENGRLRMGPQVTHLDANSPYIKSRQIQWRTKGFEQMESIPPDELFYTGPMVLGRTDIAIVRKRLVSLIQEVTDMVRKSPNEELACLNIDWFRF